MFNDARLMFNDARLMFNDARLMFNDALIGVKGEFRGGGGGGMRDMHTVADFFSSIKKN